MARIDPLLDALGNAGGEALIVTTGRPVAFLVSGALRSDASPPARTEDIVGLIEEIAPAAVRASMRREGQANFDYRSAGGVAARVHFERVGGHAFARVRLLPRAAPPAEEALEQIEPEAELEQPPPSLVAPGRELDLDLTGAEGGLELDTGGGPVAALPSDVGEAMDLDLPSDHPFARPPAESAPAKATGAPLLAREREPPSAPIPGASRDLSGLLSALLGQGGTDLHLAVGQAPRMRLHGRLDLIPGTPLAAQEVEAMLKSALRPEQQRRFEAEMALDFALSIPKLGRFRANACLERHGVRLVFRAIPPRVPTIAELGLPRAAEALTEFPNGLLLVTGPAGCGKSTTQAALIDRINETWHDHIITVEDPVEFVHAPKGCLVSQREVGTHVSSFAAALRSALREDPDVILVGEMRDLETISLTLTAAEMGALVFATVHTNSVPKTVDRLVDVFPESEQDMVRTLLAGSLRAILTQQLVKTADGKGRACAAEIAICTHGIANLIREGKIFQLASSMQAGRGEGMQTLEQALAELVEQRKITKETAYAAAINKEHLAALVGLPPEGPARGQRTPGAEGPAAAS